MDSTNFFKRGFLNGDSPAVVGMREQWGGQAPFFLHPVDRLQHVYCIGKTGTGKTTLLRNLILQDIYAGRGVGLIDPHGDLAHEIIDCIPSWRTDDVVYFNPADLEYPIGFNLLQRVPPNRRPRIASGIVGAFKSIWRDFWGPRLEYILYAAVAALLDCENVSILGIQRMLNDSHYRRWVVRQIKDPIVRSFWQDEFESYDSRFRREAIAPIQNKVGQLLMSAPIRNILGQVRRKIDSRFMMDNRRIFIANLSKGALGEDKSNLLGSLLMTSFELAAMERVDVPELNRREFFLFIDEFQNFSTESFATILSEARKYKLALTLSHQYLDQVHETVRSAVFGNIGTMISFRIGDTDAKVIAEEFGRAYPEHQYSSLANHEVVTKPLVQGSPDAPFKGYTIAPVQFRTGRRDRAIRRSRESYSNAEINVERKINGWTAGQNFSV